MNHHERWKKHYNALIQYYNRYGDAMPPSGHTEFLPDGEEINLGNWVSYMRTRYKQQALPDDRIAMLSALPSWEWGPVRPGPKSKTEVIIRNTDILARHKSGMPLSSIAKQYGLSRQRVHQIVKESYVQGI
jgi:hypothetical protein